MRKASISRSALPIPRKTVRPKPAARQSLASTELGDAALGLPGPAFARPRDEEAHRHALARRLVGEAAVEQDDRVLVEVMAQGQRPVPFRCQVGANRVGSRDLPVRRGHAFIGEAAPQRGACGNRRRSPVGTLAGIRSRGARHLAATTTPARPDLPLA